MRKLLLILILFGPLLLQGAKPKVTPEKAKVPPEKELKALVLDSLIAFNNGVRQKHFGQFHEGKLSIQRRKQIPLDQFTNTFRAFIDKDYDISNIATSDPVFDIPPLINSDGVLNLQGHYPTKPNRVAFKLSYVSESSKWKLLDFNVRAFPAGDETDKVPTGTELDSLVLKTLLSFNESLQSQNFDWFHEQISSAWKKEVTSEQLLRIFASLIDQKIDLSGITKLEAMFEPAPAINEDGHLVVNGWYPTKPYKITFALKFLYEDDVWKLIGIRVKPGSVDEEMDFPRKTAPIEDEDELELKEGNE